MYHRQLITDLRKWRESSHRKPLILRGARQVGKTTLVDEFGKEFDHYISLNLELADDAAIFRRYSNVEEVVDYLFLRHHISKQNQGTTLLFIDEIQEEARAVEMLRYFYEKASWLFVIAAGSRLQTLLHQHASFPVGRVEYLTLRPFSFLEYLGAAESDEWVKAVEMLRIDPMMHTQLTRLFNQYALIGGMPEAVATFLETNDIESLSHIYKSLQNGYSEDVERYAKSNNQRAVIRHILLHGWSEAGQAIKFARFAGSEYTSTQVHEALDVLQKAFILSLDFPITSDVAPMVPALNRSPKLVWVDTGLVNFFAGIQIEYLQNKDLLDTWRGRAAEQMVAQELRVVLDRHLRDEQYFWVRDKKGASAEIDFIWQHGSQIIPIEVKTGTNAHLRSLHAFVNFSEHPVTAIRIWSGEFLVQEACTPAPFSKPYKLINIPFYLTGLIDTIIEKFGSV